MDQNSKESLLSAIDEHPQSTYVWHSKFEDRFRHHQHVKGQLTYVEGGVIFLYANDKSYFLPGRHYLWIPAGMAHHLEHRYRSAVVRNIYFAPTSENQDPFYDKIGIYPVNNLLLEMLKYSEHWNGSIAPGTPEYGFLNTLKNILPDISKHPLPIVVPTTDNERIRPALQYIHQHLSEELTLAGIAAATGFSERTLSRIFLASLDISFFQYLKLVRITKAMEKLLESDLTISEIAYEVGYDSISSFSNTFFKMTGRRPSSFKELKKASLGQDSETTQ
ncbi:AraC family transcriptional regulator [Pedobacter gandavensis]|uniref:Helix-turn-helix domain-containing protein n=1 Tax=Pedobacter gandavensis TaxID=2679963 RepID=A0ABR6F228_9SPHI|nr:AraC family transcriptional regulator [Pedobacter gandavensis]MBB2151272.1 helix-turn-helix domain-containing protein [Pedobacter gandavensis]